MAVGCEVAGAVRLQAGTGMQLAGHLAVTSRPTLMMVTYRNVSTALLSCM